jgi:hypothetical protein
VLPINVTSTDASKVVVKTSLFYGDKSVKITAECSLAADGPQELTIDFSQVTFVEVCSCIDDL